MKKLLLIATAALTLYGCSNETEERLYEVAQAQMIETLHWPRTVQFDKKHRVEIHEKEGTADVYGGVSAPGKKNNKHHKFKALMRLRPGAKTSDIAAWELADVAEDEGEQ
jgi:hypothetical protein